jgi:hypothetical protein
LTTSIIIGSFPIIISNKVYAIIKIYCLNSFYGGLHQRTHAYFNLTNNQSQNVKTAIFQHPKKPPSNKAILFYLIIFGFKIIINNLNQINMIRKINFHVYQ